jgi:hypothetical protein
MHLTATNCTQLPLNNIFWTSAAVFEPNLAKIVENGATFRLCLDVKYIFLCTGFHDTHKQSKEMR